LSRQNAQRTRGNSPMLCNDSFTQLLPPGARIGKCKITVYMGTECLQNLNMRCFILRLYTDLIRGFLSYQELPNCTKRTIFFL